MKSPGTASAKTSGKKAKKAASKSGGKWPGKGELGRERRAERREYKGEARREDASARREEADARHREAEAEHYRQEAAKAEREGYKGEARYDLAKARREEAEARHDAARARHNQAKARTHRHKAARVGLASPGAVCGGWILGLNDRHDTCAAVAVANSLLASRGLRVSDGDVWDLYLRGGGSVLGALETSVPLSVDLVCDFSECGSGVPRFLSRDDDAPRLAVWAEHLDGGARGGPHAPHLTECGGIDGGLVAAQQLRDALLSHAGSLVLEVDLTEAQRDQSTWDAEPAPSWGPHAVLLAGDTVVSWGREIRVTEAFLAQQVTGAWLVEWSDAR